MAARSLKIKNPFLDHGASGTNNPYRIPRCLFERGCPVEKFCANICRALQQKWLSPEERQLRADFQRIAKAERERRRRQQEAEPLDATGRVVDDFKRDMGVRIETGRVGGDFKRDMGVRIETGRVVVRDIQARPQDEERRRLEKEGAAQEAERRTRPSPRAVKSEYVVWYGTNRRRYDASDLTKGYSAERDSKVHYGSCRVYIPEAHKIGSLGSPWWNVMISTRSVELVIDTVVCLTLAKWETVSGQFGGCLTGEARSLA